MGITDRVHEALERRLPLLAIWFLVLQPVLDVMGYWQQKLGMLNVVTFVLRAALLLGMLGLGFFLTRRRWVYLALGGALALYLVGHCLASAATVYVDAAEDLTEQARIFLMPATAVCFCTFQKRNPKVFPALLKGAVGSLAVILLVELLATVTGTDPHTYSNKGIGVLGWFLWANSQTAILSMLCPLVLAAVWRRWPGKLLPLTVAAAVSFTLLFFCATRLAYAALLGTGAAMGVCFLLCGKDHRRAAVILLAFTVFFGALYPISPMLRNVRALGSNEAKKQEMIYDAVEVYGVERGAKQTENRDALTVAYGYQLHGLVDRFGLDRVAAEFHNSLLVEHIYNKRLMRLNGCRLLMAESPSLCRWFGLELGKLRQDTVEYDFLADEWKPIRQAFDPENDFHGVYFLCGAVGLGGMLAFLLWFGARAVWAVLRRWREAFSPTLAAFGIAYGIGLINAWSTVSVLRRNNASVYFGLVLAGLWYLTRKREEKGGTPE